MCLDNSPTAVQTFLTKHRNRKLITVYKVLELRNGKLLSPYQSNANPWKPGTYTSNRTAPKLCLRRRDISRGIHVCLTKYGAKNKRSNLVGSMYYDPMRYMHITKKYIIVQLLAHKDDLIGVGHSESVFHKVRLCKKEYNRALNGK
jgi:hypothetical protein